MKYKGQLIARGQELVMLFVFGGILLGAGALAMAGFASPSNSTMTNQTLGNSSSGLVTFSQQLPTVGIIGGISLLILVLFIGFGAFLMRKK